MIGWWWLTSIVYAMIVRMKKTLNNQGFAQFSVLNEHIEKSLDINEIYMFDQWINRRYYSNELEDLFVVRPWILDRYCRIISSWENRIEIRSLSMYCLFRRILGNVFLLTTLMTDHWRDVWLESNIPMIENYSFDTNEMN
jgi:hypothetical protein